LCVVVGVDGSTGALRSNRIERTTAMGYSGGRDEL